MVQDIASQILNTPSEQTAPVTAPESIETKTDKPELSDFDSRLSVLTKMERKIKEAESKLKGQERDWEEKGKKLSEYEELVKLLDENPLEALKRRKGWGVQEFNEFAVQHSSDEDLDPVAKITKNFQSKMEEMDKIWEKKLNDAIKAKEEEINAKEQERQVSEFKSGIKTFLAENKDDFEFIHTEGEAAQEAVFDLIYKDIMRQQEEGIEDIKIMDIKEAAEKVENFLDSQYSKYLSLKKVKSKLQPQEEGVLARFKTQSEEPKTLNSSFAPKSIPLSQLSEEERRQAAIAFMRSQPN